MHFSDRVLLYDVLADPSERNNVAARHGEVSCPVSCVVLCLCFVSRTCPRSCVLCSLSIVLCSKYNAQVVDSLKAELLAAMNATYVEADYPKVPFIF